MKSSLLAGSCILCLGFSLPETARGQDSDRAAANSIPFRISKETTHITEPLTETGLVDYTAYLNREMSKGVTPETNAAVLYWQAIGYFKGSSYDDPEFLHNLKKELGTDPFLPGKPCLISFSDFLETQVSSANVELKQLLADQFVASLDAPWSSEYFPTIKKWLDVNQQPLETVLKATRRPKYFQPLAKKHENDDLIHILSPDILAYGSIARMLKARALLALGENRPKDAIRDLIALHRFARHCAQGATLIEMMVGVRLEAIACNGGRQLANSNAMTAQQLAGYAKQLSELPPLGNIERNIQYERFELLDAIQRHVTQTLTAEEAEPSVLKKLLGSDPSTAEATRKLLTTLLQSEIDWNVVMTRINKHYDQIDAILDEPGFKSRQEKRKQLIQALASDLETISTPAGIAQSHSATPQQRGEQMGTTVLALFGPVPASVFEAAARANTIGQLSRLGIAVAACQKQQGDFPDSLEGLVPAYLAELPNDPYTGKPFVYRIDNEGALVYSLGKNLKDDGGKPLDEDSENYDHVFRVTAP